MRRSLLALVLLVAAAGCPAQSRPDVARVDPPPARPPAEVATPAAEPPAPAALERAPTGRTNEAPAEEPAAPDEPADAAPLGLFDEVAGGVAIAETDPTVFEDEPLREGETEEERIERLQERARTESAERAPASSRAERRPAPRGKLPSGPRTSGTWHTRLADAQSEARRTRKPILAFFTGSDWCGWCKKLQAEVLDTTEFKAWAPTHVVLLELDFPRRKPMPAAVKQANEALAKRYEVTGYPTVVFLTADGAQLGRTGYLEGGPARWLPNAERAIGSR